MAREEIVAEVEAVKGEGGGELVRQEGVCWGGRGQVMAGFISAVSFSLELEWKPWEGLYHRGDVSCLTL